MSSNRYRLAYLSRILPVISETFLVREIAALRSLGAGVKFSASSPRRTGPAIPKPRNWPGRWKSCSDRPTPRFGGRIFTFFPVPGTLSALPEPLRTPGAGILEGPPPLPVVFCSGALWGLAPEAGRGQAPSRLLRQCRGQCGDVGRKTGRYLFKLHRSSPGLCWPGTGVIGIKSAPQCGPAAQGETLGLSSD